MVLADSVKPNLKRGDLVLRVYAATATETTASEFLLQQGTLRVYLFSRQR